MNYFKKLTASVLIILLIFSSFPAFSVTKSDEIIVEGTVESEYTEENTEELYEVWLNKLFYGNDISLFGSNAFIRLTGIPDKLYTFVKENILSINYSETSDTTVSTEFTLSKTDLMEMGVEVSFHASDANEAFALFVNQFDTENVIEALMHDLPFELFWYDKVTGTKQGVSITYADTYYTINKYYLRLAVAEKYRPENYNAKSPTLDLSTINSAVKSLKNAKEIVNKYKGLTDIEKLTAYKNEICALGSYDYTAASNNSFTLDSSPWQLISIFDGDETTKSVCEGYSKAFQYLCDLTEFTGNVRCITVIGTMNGGGHMWNIITLEDKNYIADITNCDTGTVGQNGRLFLAGATGSVFEGYTAVNQYYKYSSDTLYLWYSETEDYLSLVSDKCGDNLYWYVSDGIFHVKGSGDMYDIHDSVLPWINLTSEIHEVDLPDTITKIGKNAFRNFKNVKEFNIPESVREIGDAAFFNCEGITKLVFPEGIEKIGKYVVRECCNLNNIYFLGDAPEIAENAFMDLMLYAYCDSENKSWTKDKKKDYGGTLLWKDLFLCDAIGHQEVIIKGTPATCQNNGTSDGAYCKNCGILLKAQEVTEKAGHKFGDYYYLTEATCEENGVKRRDCLVCSEFETATEFATGHKIKTDKYVAPTCTEPGLTEGSYCLTCGKVLKIQESIAPLGHKYNAEITNPTCTEKGFTTYLCGVCGHSYVSDYTSALGHEKVTLPGIKPSCESEGLTEGSYCSVCGETLVKQETLGALGHRETKIKGYSATCDKEGLSDGIRCSVCEKDLLKQSVISPLGHSYSTYVTKPNCLREGYTIYTCKICGDSYKSDYLKALGHSYEATVVPPTCTMEGYTTHTCARCGDSYSDGYLKAKGHNETVIKGKDASCLEKGLTDGKICTVCGEITVKQKETAAKGHTYKAVVTSPTCAKKGFTTFTCTTCGTGYKSAYTNATGKHTYSNSTDKSCNVCGFIREVVIPSVPMYRMYDKNGGEHFYTGSTEERDFLIANGWQYEGVGFNFPVAGRPVYRLYEEKTGEHLYTMDETEKEALLAAGWNYEGVAFNSGGDDEVPQYRLHNPNATRGAYHFTGSTEERDLLISLGWEYQGIGFYSCLR